MTKLFYILLDGVGDLPDPSLNWITPLEAAYTPNLNLLARKSRSGIVYPVGKEIAPESDIAVFSMLGYTFDTSYVGRGVVEAIGAGYDFEDGELALRGNFATVADGLIMIDRRAGRDLQKSEAEALNKSLHMSIHLADGAIFRLIPTIGYRNILIIKMPNTYLSSNISNTDPAYQRIGGMGVAKEHGQEMKLLRSEPLDENYASRLSSLLVNEFTEKSANVLKDHPINLARKTMGKKPANVIILRDAGNTIPKVKKLSEKHGLNFACIADMPVEKGIARITGMDEHKAGGVNDYEEKAKLASTLIRNYDVVYIHIKGPDEPGHDGNAGWKKMVIEDIDTRFFGTLTELCDFEDIVLAVSADHSTPCQLKSHSADPVPLMISGDRVGRDGTCRFVEKNASRGSLGVMCGIDVLPRVLSTFLS